MEASDSELLRRFARDGDENSFRTLVMRHLVLVHSVAQRVTGNQAMAQDVAQSVFIRLARRAALIPRDLSLAAWLHRTARLLAIDLVRSEASRRQREENFAMRTAMNESEPLAWSRLVPVIDELVERLSPAEREVVLLRYFRHGGSYREVAEALEFNEETVRKRGVRALEKLRQLLAKQGIVTSAAALSTLLPANAAGSASPGAVAAVLQAARDVSPIPLPGPLSTILSMTTSSKITLAACLLLLLTTAGISVSGILEKKTTHASPAAHAGEPADLAMRSRGERKRTEAAEVSTQGLREILAIQNLVERRNRMTALFDRMRSEQFSAVGRAYRELEQEERNISTTGDYRYFISAWVECDAVAAASYERDAPACGRIVDDAIREWMNYDPAAAIAWARRNPGWLDGSTPEINPSLDGCLKALTETNPEQAKSLAQEILADPESQKEERVTALSSQEPPEMMSNRNANTCRLFLAGLPKS